jgi:hypothetical protein
MEVVPVKIVPRSFGETERRDSWWWDPLLVFGVLGSFVVYATWVLPVSTLFEDHTDNIRIHLSACILRTSHHL